MVFKKAQDISSWRRVALSTWGAPRDPTAYGTLDLECDQVLRRVDDARARTGEHVTLTHVVGKAAALAIAAAPEVNGFASFGRLMLREAVDVFFQVAFFDGGGAPPPRGARPDANLAGAKVCAADKKSVVEIARELREKADALRSRGDAPTAKVARALKRLPGPLVHLAMSAADVLTYDLGVDLTRLGIPQDPFGSCMVTNIGTFGIGGGHAPLIPYARVPVILTLGAVREAPVVDGGLVVARKVVTLGVAFDHRVMDGYHAGVMARRFGEAFRDPDGLFA